MLMLRRLLPLAALAGVFLLPAARPQTAAVHPAPVASPAPAESGKPTLLSGIQPGADLRIIAYGDMRFTNPANQTDTNPRVRQWLAGRIGEEKPDVLLLSGDMPFYGSNPADWERYRQETASWTRERLRVYPTLGNHELMSNERKGLENYFAAYPELQENRYYSVLLGSVYLITLDSTQKIEEGSPQFEWLDAQLAHLPPQVDFVILLQHMPLMADVQSQFIANLPSNEDWALKSYLEEKAASSRARFIVVSGHIHNYERFYHAGITYLVSGGGGARPYPVLVRGPQDKYQDEAYPNFNYIVLELHGKRIAATMYRVADPEAAQLSVEAKDRFVIEGK